MCNNPQQLQLHIPSYAELSYRQQWMGDPEMMSYNAGWHISHPGYDNSTGCIDWPQSEWQQFLDVYCSDATRAGYFYLAHTPTHQFIGHAHYRIVDDEAHIGINVIPVMRNQGLASLGLRLLLDHIQVATSARVAVNEFESSRLAAVRLHHKLGFIKQATAESDSSVHPATGEPIVRWVYQFSPRHDATTLLEY
ncbi:GNAT family N-acetyltransferase [Arcanobacterium pinnipediorum]|uniref:GNAT family N-acetyltransferase n=1 Tax=Arcanobacterium pinnipediorum TaxID=1503041 RepID=A0ABY5AIV6_9ACTO|nr:GNAT family N-acetyltransferase [Arcanobacterium pinnipediorum]USR79169.1 GNAT family N-acetyltransferase [Arcanobacterium pinnipediorum]